MVQLDRRARKVLKVLKERQDLLGQRGLRELKVTQELKVLKEH